MTLPVLWPLFDEEDEGYDEYEGGGAVSAAEPGTVTFPVTNLVTRIQIALGADLSADPLTWNWLDITEWVRYDLGISLTVNRRDEQTTTTTGTAQMKLDNRDGRFTRRNPTGPYYGLLSKNTPIWATISAGSGEKTRLEMYVNEWPKDWSDKSATDSTVTIKCAGVLRRLQQGEVLQSALRRTYLSSAEPTLLAYWPCEDAEGATSVASGLPGGIPLRGTIDPHFSTGIAGSGGALDLIQLPSTQVLDARITLPSASGFQVEYTGLSDAGSTVIVLHVECGIVFSFLSINSAIADGNPHHVTFQFVQNGGNVDTIIYRDGVFISSTPTAGTLTTNLHIEPFTVETTNTLLLSHIAVYGFADMEAPPASRASAVDGFAGEQAHARIARLCGEEGIPYQSSAPESPAMGPQSTGTLLSILREAEAVGGGVLYEKRWGLAYQSLAERYNQSVGMALDFAQGQIADIPRPADDDQRTRNRFTASRPNGSEYTAEQTDGPMGTGAQGPGVYDDSATLNVETDNQLSSQAGWRIHLGTIDEDRWPDVGLNFAHDPDLIDTWCSLGYGARITLANPLPQMPPDPPDLIIEGHSERWDQRMWTASLNCSPASAYRVNVVGSTDGNQGRVDAANSTLVADVTDVGTTLSVASPAALWRTGAVNFDLEVGGERMTVTNISGGSSPQSFTVTRSVNSIVKAQPAIVGGFATKVRLWKPAKVAL